MSGVQIAHRRHKTDANAPALPLQGAFLHGGGVRDDLHETGLTELRGDFTKEKAAPEIFQRGEVPPPTISGLGK
jgi:hypothetical protein